MLPSSSATPKRPKPGAVSPKQRKRNAQKRGRAASKPAAPRPRKTTAAAGESISLRGRVVRVADGSWRVRTSQKIRSEAIESEVPPLELDGVELEWLRRTSGKQPVLVPVESNALRGRRQRWRERQLLGLAPIPPGSLITVVSARPPGQGILEQLPLPKAAHKIGDLLRGKAETRNVVELLCGYRVVPLRRPLTSAYKAIGWERLKMIMEARPDGWPDDLRDLVFAEVKANKARIAKINPLKGPGGGADYVLDDW